MPEQHEATSTPTPCWPLYQPSLVNLAQHSHFFPIPTEKAQGWVLLNFIFLISLIFLFFDIYECSEGHVQGVHWLGKRG